jgi:hypothetical protein
MFEAGAGVGTRGKGGLSTFRLVDGLQRDCEEELDLLRLLLFIRIVGSSSES